MYESEYATRAPRANENPELGLYRDNESAFAIALHKIRQGNRRRGYKILFELKEHIRKTGERKSVTWLLPQVEAELGSPGLEYMCSHGDSSRRAPTHPFSFPVGPKIRLPEKPQETRSRSGLYTPSHPPPVESYAAGFLRLGLVCG